MEESGGKLWEVALEIGLTVGDNASLCGGTC